MDLSPGFRDLKVYQLSFSQAMEIFHESKIFPPEEKYSLTDQVRRASKSVPSNISEDTEEALSKDVRQQDGRRRWRSNRDTGLAGCRTGLWLLD
jgi:hypothetical protein